MYNVVCTRVHDIHVCMYKKYNDECLSFSNTLPIIATPPPRLQFQLRIKGKPKLDTKLKLELQSNSKRISNSNLNSNLNSGVIPFQP